jgi:uncharacterized Zn finger protein
MSNIPDLSKQIDMSQAESVKCESCESSTFQQTLLLKKISAIVSPSGKEILIPVAVFKCDKCDHVNKDFLDIDPSQYQ